MKKEEIKKEFEKHYLNKTAILSNGIEAKIIDYKTLNGFCEGVLIVTLDVHYKNPFTIHTQDIVALEYVKEA